MSSESQVVEFTLDGQQYCVSIEYVAEVIKFDGSSLTALPDAPPHVEGLLDLRGDTTTVINPKRRLDLGEASLGDRILVFNTAENDGSVGWAVDNVEQVSRVSEDIVEDSADSETLEGIVNREEEMLLWVRPDVELT